MWQILRFCAGQGRERRGRDCIDVALGSCAALQLLWRHVAESAGDGAAARGLQAMPNRTEIDQREAAVWPAHDVGGLDVAMNHRRR